MIAPLIPYGIKGIIWYQGEANVGKAELYKSLFPTMVNDWRKRWNDPLLPFFFVQLPGFGKTPDPSKAEWAELREAQESALGLKMTGMAPSIDLGDAETIHPLRKREVGRRLAGFALSRVYRKGTPSFCPTVLSAKKEGIRVRVVFQDVYGSLKTRDGGETSGIEVLGEDGTWVKATGQILRNQLLVSGSWRGVRYLWSDNPTGNLVNAFGLPVAPFRVLL
jgi:sialate O-acetylesterase